MGLPASFPILIVNSGLHQPTLASTVSRLVDTNSSFSGTDTRLPNLLPILRVTSVVSAVRPKVDFYQLPLKDRGQRTMEMRHIYIHTIQYILDPILQLQLAEANRTTTVAVYFLFFASHMPKKYLRLWVLA